MSERFRPTRQVHARRFDGEMILLDLGGGKYFSLDEVGAVIWERLAAGATLMEAVDGLVAHYDVERATALRDAQDLVERLIAAGLLERRGQAAPVDD